MPAFDIGVLSPALSGASLLLLLLIAAADARSGVIPDIFNAALIAAAAFYGFLTAPFSWVSALVAGTFFAFQWIVSGGSWVGSGDILLGIGIGFLLGDLSRLFVALAAAYIAGALFASILLVRGMATKKSALPFGPFLAGGAFFSFVFSERIFQTMGM